MDIKKIPNRDLLENIDLRHLKHIAAICYAGRSGSYLLSNLFDGHSSLLSCPPHALHNSPFTLYNILKYIVERRISDLDTMISLIVQNHPLLFKDANHEEFLGKPYANIPVGVNKEKFISNALVILNSHIKKYDSFGVQDLFVLVHWAYESCKENCNFPKNPSIIWQRHLPLSEKQGRFLKTEFDSFLTLTCVRRLECAIDSHLVHHIYEKPKGTKEEVFKLILHQFCSSIQKKNAGYPQFAIKFEDLHLNTRNVMQKLSDLIGVSYEKIFEETTLDREPFYFYKNGEMITGTNKTLPTKSVLKVLTQADVQFFQIYFSKFYEAYLYDVEPSNMQNIINSEGLSPIFGSIPSNSIPLDLI